MGKFLQARVFGAGLLLLAVPPPVSWARQGFLPNGSMKIRVPKTDEMDLKGSRKKLISTFDPVTRAPIVFMQDGKFLLSGATDPDRTKPYCKLTLKDSVSGVDFATSVQTTGGLIARYEYGPRCSVAKQDLLVQKSLKGREGIEIPRIEALSAIACSGRLETRTVGSLKKSAMAPHRLTGDLFRNPAPSIQFVTVPNLDEECFLEKDPCVRMLNECSPGLFGKADAKGCVKKQQNIGISDSVPLNSVKITFEKDSPLVLNQGVEVTSITCQPGTVDHTAGLPETYSDYGMKVIGAWGSTSSRAPASSSVLIESDDLEKVMGAKFFEGTHSAGGNRKVRKGPGG